MTFLFDCKDEIALPAAYGLIDKISAYAEKLKAADIPEDKDKGKTLKSFLQRAMVSYPKETSELLSRLWVLDEGEDAPNAFVTMATLFGNEVAINFFTSVVPSVLSISNAISPRQK